jgi:hypothetical protein
MLKKKLTEETRGPVFDAWERSYYNNFPLNQFHSDQGGYKWFKKFV